jgi:hypothetical protein
MLLSQVKMLAIVGVLYSGDDVQFSTCNRYHSDLVTFCHSRWKQNDIPDATIDMSNDVDYVTKEYKTWIERESLRRTGYCIWVCVVGTPFGEFQAEIYLAS